MSYSISIFRKEVKQAEMQTQDKNFFENDKNIMPFTTEQRQALKSRLLAYNYGTVSESVEQTVFEKSGAEALLTNKGLYFSATGDDIFEISMTSSEFTDSEQFVKYDPQNGGWE